MAGQQNIYESLKGYPANPYIMGGPQNRMTRPGMQQQGQPGQANIMGGGMGLIPGQGGSAGLFSGGGGNSGWWSAPEWRGGGGGSGQAWANKNYSQPWLDSVKQMYGYYGNSMNQIEDEWGAAKPGSMADMWKGYMQGSPELEQMEYNRALARLKGQTGTAQQGLAGSMGAMRGGMDSGAYAQGMGDINRQLLQGTGEIATQAAMKNLADRETRQKQLIDYTQGDVNNQMGWLQGLTGARQGNMQGYQGWMGQMMPYEQFNIQEPARQAAEMNDARFKRAMAEEQMNAQRRNEMGGWFDRMTGWQGQQGNQYYGGQGQWGNYQGNRGQAVLGGYGPQWTGY